MVHRFLLLLPRGRRMEADEVTCRVELEALGPTLGVYADDDRRWVQQTISIHEWEANGGRAGVPMPNGRMAARWV